MVSPAEIYTAERTIRGCGSSLYIKQFLMSWKYRTLVVMWDVLSGKLLYNNYLEDDEVTIVENIIRKHLTNE